uniref:Uncharacterized protein n=1 Tax=Rhizophora mucronata TaxID=61149 RepID=A0A2P2NBL8_RHIMU
MMPFSSSAKIYHQYSHSVKNPYAFLI